MCVMAMLNHVTETLTIHASSLVNVSTTHVENSVTHVAQDLYRSLGCLPKLDTHLFVNVSFKAYNSLRVFPHLCIQ